MEKLRKIMQDTQPITLTPSDKLLVQQPFYIMWVIPPEQYKENMVLGRDITEAVVTTKRAAGMLQAWFQEKHIENMTIHVERVRTLEENMQAAMEMKR